MLAKGGFFVPLWPEAFSLKSAGHNQSSLSALFVSCVSGVMLGVTKEGEGS